MDIEHLNSEYGIAGQLEFVKGGGGFPFILISNRSVTALISVYTYQVLSFQHFICVEAENLVTDAVEIPPGSEYRLLTSFKILRE